MGKKRYTKCVELLEKFKGQRIGFMRLQSEIMKEIGGDPRTISNVIKLMMETKLIKDIGQSHFLVNNED